MAKSDHHYVIIECNVSISKLSTHRDLYQQAHCVYGTEPHDLSADKFHHTYANDNSLTITERMVDDLSKKLVSIVHETGLTTACLLPMFHFFYNTHYWNLHFIQHMQAKYSHDHIHVLTSDYEMYTLIRCEFNDTVSATYIWPHRTTLRCIIRQWITRTPYFVWVTANYLVITINIIRILILQIRHGHTPIPPNQLWLILDTKKNPNLSNFHQLCKDNQLPVQYITRDYTASNSLYQHVTIRNSLVSGWRCMKTLKTLYPYVPKALRSYFVAKPYFETFIMNQLFHRYNPKLVLYTCEVYTSGRVIACAASGTSVITLGFQHAINSKHHAMYHYFKLFKKLPETLPHYFLIYGDYSERLYASYGYPKSQMVKVGFDRLPKKQPTINVTNTPKSSRTLLWISPPTAAQFEPIYHQLLGYGFETIYIRPHPCGYTVFEYEPMDRTVFHQRYPQAICIDPFSETASESMARTPIVFSIIQASTVLFEAISIEKVVVFYRPYPIADMYDIHYWGAQVVDNLDHVNWNQSADPSHVLAESTAQVDSVQWIKEIP